MTSRAARPGVEVSRILFVHNMPPAVTGAELYRLFGKYGALRQVRRGNTDKTRGTAFIVFCDAADARTALESVRGFNMDGRFVNVAYYYPKRKDPPPTITM